MATTETNRSFDDMLNEWLNYGLLKEELIKRDYLLNTVKKDNDWKGGTLPVPFKGAHASSVRFGNLTASNDVHEDEYVRGQISNQPEVWGTMKFNHRDIMEHNGRVKEQSFLKLLPGAIDEFMDNFKNCVSIQLLSGTIHARGTVDGTNIAGGGLIGIDRIERFSLGMKVQIKTAAPLSATFYIISIDVNNYLAGFSATRGGTAADMSAYLVADGIEIYLDGGEAAGMTSLRGALLTALNGGTAALYGQTKLDYPYLQAINIDGSGFSTATIHKDIFNAFTTVKNIGKGAPDTALVSYKWLGHLMANVEHGSNIATNDSIIGKGAYNVQPGSMKASLYGWTEIIIHGVKGSLKVVGIQEMDDDIIMFIDWRALKFHSNNFFTKRINPDGRQFYEVREETGYYYLIDICLFGDLVVSKPSYCGIIHDLP